jgi:hypothetical protein
MSKAKNKNVDSTKKQACGRYTILADVAKKVTEAAKKTKLKITIE